MGQHKVSKSNRTRSKVRHTQRVNPLAVQRTLEQNRPYTEAEAHELAQRLHGVLNTLQTQSCTIQDVFELGLAMEVMLHVYEQRVMPVGEAGRELYAYATTALDGARSLLDDCALRVMRQDLKITDKELEQLRIGLDVYEQSLVNITTLTLNNALAAIVRETERNLT